MGISHRDNIPNSLSCGIQHMELSMELRIQNITIELLMSHTGKEGSVGSGCEIDPSRYPNLPLPQITS